MVISFSSSIAVARNFKTLLHSSGESGHLCLVPNLRRNAFSFLTLRMVFAADLLYYDLYYVEVNSFYAHAHFLEFFFFFNKKWVLNFVKSFFCICWDDHMVLFFNLLIWYITLVDLCILRNPCLPGINPTWSWCMIHLMCCWIQLVSILLIFLHLCSSVILTCSFLFLWYVFLVLVSGEGDGTPLQYSCLENPMDGGAWWAAVHGVAKSWTRLSDFPFTFHFHALEKEMTTHSSVLAWRIPGTGEPGGLPSMGSHRAGHDWIDLAAAVAAAGISAVLKCVHKFYTWS